MVPRATTVPRATMVPHDRDATVSQCCRDCGAMVPHGRDATVPPRCHDLGAAALSPALPHILFVVYNVIVLIYIIFVPILFCVH